MQLRRAKILSTLGLVATILLGVATQATATTGDAEGAFLADTNAARAGNGAGPLSSSSDLVALARQHSADMAAQNRLYHTPNLGSQVANWQTVGENVGTGSDEPSIEAAFMASPEHRTNILLPAYTQIGIGVVVSGGRLWVTEIFRQPAGASAARPAPAPAGATPAFRPSGPRPAPPAAAPVASAAPEPAGPEAAAPEAAAHPADEAVWTATIDTAGMLPAPPVHTDGVAVLGQRDTRPPAHVPPALAALAGVLLLIPTGGLAAVGLRRTLSATPGLAP